MRVDVASMLSFVEDPVGTLASVSRSTVHLRYHRAASTCRLVSCTREKVAQRREGHGKMALSELQGARGRDHILLAVQQRAIALGSSCTASSQQHENQK